MARMILLCGKLCAGKTTYARQLMRDLPAARLNPDEVMLSLFGEYLGGRHEEIFDRTMQLIFHKAVELHRCGLHVVIDAGFWQRGSREAAAGFFADAGIVPEWHYVRVTDDVWRAHIASRNSACRRDEYHVDERIIAKFTNPTDEPSADAMDVVIDAE